MEFFTQRILSLICCCFILSGCAQKHGGFTDTFQRGIELADTPFFSQKAMQCGPASLATVLGATGVDVHPDILTPQLFLPQRQGTLQLELAGAARRYGRLPYVIEPDPDALVSELLAGRPVLVLQNLGFRSFPHYHYAVVVGILPGGDVVLRSGTTQRQVMDENRFLRVWERADFWGLVVLSPGELPARPDSAIYLKEVAALEAMGQWQAAELSYRTALGEWPNHPVALFGLANSQLLQKKYSEAENLFRKLLEIYPDHPAAMNNLAETLMSRGCHDEALDVVDRALALQLLQPDFLDVLHRTRQEIRRLKLEGHGQCTPPTATGVEP